MADCDWAGLPNHVLGLVLSRLPFPDLIKSRAVCKSWLAAATREVDPRKPRAPMLMLAGDPTDENSEYRTLFSLSDQNTYRLHLPQIRGQRVLGTADGWLVTVDNDDAELHLINAFTRAVHPLPSITTLSIITSVERDPLDGRVTGYTYIPMPGYDDDEAYFVDLQSVLLAFHHRAVIFSSSDDSSLPALTVFIMYGDYQYLAFAKVGDERWTDLRTCLHPDWHFNDVVLHKGMHYGVVCGAGYIIGFDISSSPPKKIFKGPLNHGGTADMYYLVESLDGTELLQIWRYQDWVLPDGDYDGVPASSSGEVYKTQTFIVSKLDADGNTMTRVERLEEGTAMFLGDNRSMMLRTRDLPELQDNCIYFTDGDIEQYLDKRQMRRDVGVFDMKDGSIKSLYPRESPLNRLTWPPPVWLTFP